MSKNRELFKEQITKGNERMKAAELCAAIDAGEEALLQLLFNTTAPEKYQGIYHKDLHNRCSGTNTNRFTEKRLCRCLYYGNSGHEKDCENCGYKANKKAIAGEYRITDYEVPAFYDGPGIGEIDLILERDGQKYAVEVKPPKGNYETLLRMIAEIMTYTMGYPAGEYQKAIGFFEGTDQEKEYQVISPEVRALIEKANITVFHFRETVSGEAYTICKL